MSINISIGTPELIIDETPYPYVWIKDNLLLRESDSSVSFSYSGWYDFLDGASLKEWWYDDLVNRSDTSSSSNGIALLTHNDLDLLKEANQKWDRFNNLKNNLIRRQQYKERLNSIIKTISMYTIFFPSKETRLKSTLCIQWD